MNLNRLVPFLVTGLLLAAAAAQGGEIYGVDPYHSEIGFRVRHFGVSNVRGNFKKYTVDLIIDEDDPTQSTVELSIDAGSIFTDHEQRDNHLRSADFLDVENHPEILFKSRKIEHLGGEEYVAEGGLTIRGVTLEIELPLILAGPLVDPLKMKRLGVEGGLTIDRRDYGVSWNRVMDHGGLFVGNEVEISISIEAARRTDEDPVTGQD
jgi:polyisoprenoid-binding protein YceI